MSNISPNNYRRTARVTGNMANNEEARVKLKAEGCIEFMEWGCSLYPTDLPLAVNTCWAIRKLCRHNIPNSEAVIASGIFKHIVKCLGINYQNNEFAEHFCHSIINISYKSNENKIQVED